jgi:hypothetical protein
MKFRKSEIKKYEWLIGYIRKERKNGRDFWSSLFDGGLTFVNDIQRFCDYALQVGALDISKEILENTKHYFNPLKKVALKR